MPLRRGIAALCLAAAIGIPALIAPADNQEGLSLVAALVALIGLWWVARSLFAKPPST